jgi:hypothetical protein
MTELLYDTKVPAEQSKRTPEGSILLANFIGYLKPAKEANLYQFEHHMLASGVDIKVYQNYFKQRENRALSSSAGCTFKALAFTPLPDSQGFKLILKAN